LHLVIHSIFIVRNSLFLVPCLHPAFPSVLDIRCSIFNTLIQVKRTAPVAGVFSPATHLPHNEGWNSFRAPRSGWNLGLFLSFLRSLRLSGQAVLSFRRPVGLSIRHYSSIPIGGTLLVSNTNNVQNSVLSIMNSLFLVRCCSAFVFCTLYFLRYSLFEIPCRARRRFPKAGSVPRLP
jgi:hypothetical protein